MGKKAIKGKIGKDAIHLGRAMKCACLLLILLLLLLYFYLCSSCFCCFFFAKFYFFLNKLSSLLFVSFKLQ